MRFFCLFLCATIMSACGGNVSSTVLQDFGLQERPEDYEYGRDRVMKTLQTVGATELKRLNIANRHGEIKYEETDNLRGGFYKEVRIYTRHFPLDAKPVGRTGNKKQGGFNGLVEYAYEFKESPRFANRTEAAASNAQIPGLQNGGRERYRYRFSTGGNWDGSKGELVRH